MPRVTRTGEEGGQVSGRTGEEGRLQVEGTPPTKTERPWTLTGMAHNSATLTGQGQKYKQPELQRLPGKIYIE